MTPQELLVLSPKEAIGRTIRVFDEGEEIINNGTIIEINGIEVLVEWEDGYENSTISLLSNCITQII